MIVRLFNSDNTFSSGRCLIPNFYIASCLQRAWLIKLLALELHVADMGIISHRETCQKILAHLFGVEVMDAGGDHTLYSSYALQSGIEPLGARAVSKNKVLELSLRISLLMACLVVALLVFL